MVKNSRKLMLGLLAGFLLSAMGLSLSGSTTHSSNVAAARNDPFASQVKEITGYRSWAKVNVDPVQMPPRTALDCRAPMRLPDSVPAANGQTNPHFNKYLTVYVNSLGQEAMFKLRKPVFPEGSVIVKEKLPDVSSQTPELLTVMIKRGKGFNPPSGDWEYMVVDGSGTKVEARGKLKNCQGCHFSKPETDYIFRTYLSDEVMNKLK